MQGRVRQERGPAQDPLPDGRRSRSSQRHRRSRRLQGCRRAPQNSVVGALRPGNPTTSSPTMSCSPSTARVRCSACPASRRSYCSVARVPTRRAPRQRSLSGASSSQRVFESPDRLDRATPAGRRARSPPTRRGSSAPPRPGCHPRWPPYPERRVVGPLGGSSRWWRRRRHRGRRSS